MAVDKYTVDLQLMVSSTYDMSEIILNLLSFCNHKKIKSHAQAESNSLTGDPFACFDWFGYTNVNLLDPLHYATHGAPQMDAAFQMLQRASRA